MIKRKTSLVLAVMAVMAVIAFGTTGLTMAQAEGSKVESYEESGTGWGRGGHPAMRKGHAGPESGGLGMFTPGGPRGKGLRMALRHLDLSESQVTEIRSIFETDRESAQSSHEHMRALGAELSEQIERDPYNEAAVREKAAAVAELGVEMAVLRARKAGQVRSVLTPEQIEQLELMKEDRKAFREERRERFGQRREGFERRRERRPIP